MVIDRTVIRFYGWALIAAGAAAGGAHLVWGDLSITGGVALGWLVGMLPFLSWHFVVWFTEGFRNKSRIGIAVLVMLAKYAAIIGLFFWIFSSASVNVLAIAGGMFIIAAILPALGLKTLSLNKDSPQHRDKPIDHTQHVG